MPANQKVTEPATAAELFSVERELRWLINNTDEPFLLVNTALQIVTFNLQFEKVYNTQFGIEVKKGMLLLELAYPERRAMLSKLYEEVLTGQHRESVLAIQQADGDYRVFEMRYVPARDENRQIIGIFITARETTEARKAEEQKQKMTVLLRQAEAISHIGSFEIVSANGDIHYSEEFARITGLSPGSGSANYRRLLQHIEPADRVKAIQQWRKSLRDYSDMQLELRMRLPDGEDRYLKCSGQYQLSVLANEYQFFGIVSDITREKLSGQQLAATMNSLKERNKEQQCLYRITRLSTEESDIPRLLEMAAGIIPSGLMYTELAEAGIVFNNTRYKTPNFRHTHTRISVRRLLRNGQELLVEAGYLENSERQTPDFLPEENKLLETIVGALQLQLEKMLALQVVTDERQRYLSLFRSAPALICILRGVDLRIEFANPLFEKLAGVSPVQNRHLSDLFVFEPGFDMEDRLRVVIESGRELVLQDVPMLVHRDYSNHQVRRFVNMVCQPYRDSTGEVTGVIVYGIDLTSQVEARKALFTSEQNYRTVFEDSPHPLWIVDPDSYRFLDANRTACRRYGYTKSEFQSMQLRDIHPPEDAGLIRDLSWQTIDGAKVYHGEWRHRTRDGEIRDVEISAHQITYAGRMAVLALVHDITERVQAERRLVQLQYNQEALIDNTDDLIWSVDKNFCLITGNRAFIRNINQKSGLDLAPGDSLLNPALFDERMIQSWQQLYGKALAGESIETEIYIAAQPTVSESWLHVRIRPIMGPSGIVGIACYARDITVSRHYARRLLEINQKLETAQQIARMGYWELDLVSGRLFWTKEVYVIWGVEADQFATSLESFLASMHPDDLSKFELINQHINEGAKELDFSHRVILPDGSIRHVREKGEVICNEEGTPIRLEGTVQDISEQVEQLNAIIRAQENLDAVINSTNDLIWSVGKDMRLITANRAFVHSMKRVFGRIIQPGESIYQVILSDHGVKTWKERYERALAGASFQLEDAFEYPGEGEQHHLMISFAPFYQGEGTPAGVVCYAKDISELKRSNSQMESLNRELMRKTEELATSNVELERFAYVASHDLQEPLRMVSSFMQLLEKKYGHLLDATGQEYIHYAVDGADRMKRLIQDLLNYTRLEAAQEDPGDTDMNQVVQEVIYTLSDRIQKSNASVEFGTLPVLSGTHRTQMFQLIQNLVSNGIKYNQQEKPVVRIDALDQSDHWLFQVSDNGIGIDPRYFDKIFMVFQRLHARQQYSGTGIGLSVCKKIVERAGGNIWVDSVAGAGSTFSFTIPKMQAIS